MGNPAHSWLSGLRRYRRGIVLAACSLPLFGFTAYASYWLRFEGQIEPVYLRQIGLALPWVLLIKLCVFAWFRVYQGWNRYLTFYDLVVLAQASVGSSLLLVLGAYFLLPEDTVPRSVFLLDCLGTIIVCGGLRSVGRLAHEMELAFLSDDPRVRAIIVGANDAGETLLRAIRNNRRLAYRIVGFLATTDGTRPIRIGGVPVLGEISQLARVIRHQRVDEILLTADELTGVQVRQIMQSGQSAGAEVKVLPSFEQILEGRIDLRPRTVSIADLLRRDPVKLDMRGLHQWIDGKVLFVTGAAGSIGSEICRQLLQFEPRKLVLIDRNENGQFYLQQELENRADHLRLECCMADVADRRRMEQLIREHRPDIIFHAAAYKHVPMMESNPGEAIKNVVLATRNLADLAHQHEVGSFVMISTDKAVNPTSVMGACKRMAEIYVQALAAESKCQFVTVRFGNVLDSAGSVVPIFREQIARGGPVTVTHPEMTRYFMMIPEASQLVIQAGALGRGGEIFVLDMGEPVRIVDLAREMIHLSGLEVGRDIEIEFTGVRPGEKLFEELHHFGERGLPTMHPKIMIADAQRLSLRQADAAIRHLADHVDQPVEVVIEQLSQVVPQYPSNRRQTTRLAA